MNAPRIIAARPMGHADILPLIREVGSLRERGEYGAAAELEERIRQPTTVAGRVLEPCGDRDMRWYHHDVMLTARCDEWCAVLTTHGEPDTAIQVQTQGRGPTIAAALADAHAPPLEHVIEHAEAIEVRRHQEEQDEADGGDERQEE